MTGSARLALLLAACMLALGGAPAQAATKLRAQIAQATPTPTVTPMNGSELSEDPPGLDEDEDEPTGGGGDSESGTGGGSDRDLPNTGADALLVALMGLGLIGTGLGLRRRLAHGGLGL